MTFFSMFNNWRQGLPGNVSKHVYTTARKLAFEGRVNVLSPNRQLRDLAATWGDMFYAIARELNQPATEEEMHQLAGRVMIRLEQLGETIERFEEAARRSRYAKISQLLLALGREAGVTIVYGRAACHVFMQQRNLTLDEYADLIACLGRVV